jgi:hypothetical protein
VGQADSYSLHRLPVCFFKGSIPESLGCPPNASDCEKNKQSIEFCTSGGALRDSGPLPAGLIVFKFHLAVHHPVKGRRLGDII